MINQAHKELYKIMISYGIYYDSCEFIIEPTYNHERYEINFINPVDNIRNTITFDHIIIYENKEDEEHILIGTVLISDISYFLVKFRDSNEYSIK